MTKPAQPQYLIGVDENGLGARLGPMFVTGVLARVNEDGARWLKRSLPRGLRKDLGDSKGLVAFGNSALGEAWARALLPEHTSPSSLLDALVFESDVELKQHCPKSASSQCWGPLPDEFEAEIQVVKRISRHVDRLKQRGVEVVGIKSSLVCTGRLNREKEAGLNRFVSDLHAMERLVLAFREQAGTEVLATCGKVGGIADYDRFFGPLAGRLHAVLQKERPHSAYRFPGIGELHFIQDADAADPLVMLASMVGKYLRELCMGRISQFYVSQLPSLRPVSGYHDAVTTRLVNASKGLRKQLALPKACFERE